MQPWVPSISPLIANLFMEEFEAKALQSAPHLQPLGKVCGWHPGHPRGRTQQFLQHINSQDPNIQFTVEEPGTDGSTPFLDTKVKPGPNNTINTTVYRKPTHTDQYLHWDSNHFITAKNSVYNTLAHGAKVVSSTTEDLNKEMEHLNKTLKDYHFPNWALNRLQLQFQQKHNLNNINTQGEAQTINNNQDNNNRRQNKSIYMVVPYIKGIGEKFKKSCYKQGIQVHFKGTNTVKQLLMAPKDKDPKLTKSGVIYRYQCPNINCTEQYIRESGRSLGERYREHLKALSQIHLHTSTTGHPDSPDCFSIVDREAQGFTRNIKEVMYIKVKDPSLKRNMGKFLLPQVWDQVLKGTPSLQLK